jgi:hypothetical protein
MKANHLHHLPNKLGGESPVVRGRTRDKWGWILAWDPIGGMTPGTVKILERDKIRG